MVHPHLRPDLGWSPSGEYIIAGCTDNTACVFASADGTSCVTHVFFGR